MPFLKRKNTIRNVVRLRKILVVFSKYGFHTFIEKIKLGKYIYRSSQMSGVDQYTMAQRLRMSFEQLGPTFVKLGQLLSTRPDLIPAEFVEEFKKFHYQVRTVHFDDIEPVLNEQFHQSVDEVFDFFDKEPIAAASIAQVYQAKLKSGKEVVVKVQRPGIQQVIREDLDLLYFLVRLMEKYVEEAKNFNLRGIVDEFSKTLRLETDFVVEANNIRKCIANFSDDENVVIPQVHLEYSGHRVLVMDKLKGFPLSHEASLNQSGVDAKSVLRAGLGCYFKMVFEHGFFHGDLHAGNLFVLENNKIGLIDFGVVGRLNHKTQNSIANMLIALANENYERVAYEYIEISPYSDKVDVDRLATDIRDILAPYYGLTLRNVNIGKLLLSTVSVASEHQLMLPTDLILFFKSIVTIEGMGRTIADDFDFLEYSIEFANEILKTKVNVQRIKNDMLEVTRDYNSLLTHLPRQLKQLLRKFNSPNFDFKVSIRELESLRRSHIRSAKIINSGFVIAALIIGGTMFAQKSSEIIFFGLPMLSLIFFSLAIIIWFTTFFR